MIIYKITNLVNGKSYIGQTRYNFKKRYNNSIKWWVYTGNCVLKNSAKKNGHENFEISILRDDIKSLKELNLSEIHYIKKYNSLYPNGYNFCSGGQNKDHSDFTKEKMSAVKRDGIKYKFRSPDGKIFEFFNLSKFCQERNLNIAKMSNVSNNIRNHHKGWTLPETKLKQKQIYHFLSPNGSKHTFIGKELPNFCKKMKLFYTAMVAVWKDRVKSHEGWTKDKIYD